MYEVILPLVGYGYQIGDKTDKIKPEDIKKFLEHGMIKEIKVVKKKAE